MTAGIVAASSSVYGRTLQRRFRQATGQTPLQYLNRKRIEAATDMLRASNLSVSDVAWQVGFGDVSYFTRLFRQHTGLTPARYRQSVRGKLFGTRMTCLAFNKKITKQ